MPVVDAVIALSLLSLILILGRARRRALGVAEERTDQLQHQSLHDPLTGLPNRDPALKHAKQMLARARAGQLSIAAFHIDIDGFRQINDTFGHKAGDECLRLIAARLADVVSENTAAARLSGDEFLVLTEGSALDDGPRLVAERFLKILREPYDLGRHRGRELSITASIGVAYGMRDNAEELLRDADVALYQAKAAGRNRYMVFEAGMQTVAHEQLTIELDLATALHNEELFLLYQPTFDQQSEQTIGVEALIRWRHPTRGIVSPAQFIPIAEASGLIVPIGRWVLDTACLQAATWHTRGHRIGVSVNVSGRQLEHDRLLEDVAQALEHSGLRAGALTLEITETALMRDAAAATRRLRELKLLGVRIAIDDFGTGYSSLAYLRQFPVDTLKIDRAFISGMVSSKQSLALLQTLVQLGKNLQIDTLAEGIEDRLQLETLQRERCDHGQGFLFSRPLEVDTLEAFLERSYAAHASPR